MNRSSQTAGAHDWPLPQGSSAQLPTPPLIPTPMPSLDLLLDLSADKGFCLSIPIETDFQT